jgi:hypothetical protein
MKMVVRLRLFFRRLKENRWDGIHKFESLSFQLSETGETISDDVNQH